MSVIVEFTIQGDAFPFGRAVRATPGMELTLERIVPSERVHIPYFWASGGNFEEFERHILEERNIKSVSQLDRINDDALYRVEWTDTEQSLINGIRVTKGTILEAYSNGSWHFRLRFLNHDYLRDFYNYCDQHRIEVRLDRVYTLTEASQDGRSFNLTPAQREGLVFALQRGYFGSPKQVTLRELAEELSISKQALSQRLRRGNEKVLQEALASPASAET